MTTRFQVNLAAQCDKLAAEAEFTAMIAPALGVLFDRLPKLSLPHLEHLKWNQRGNVRSVESLVGVW